VARACHGHGGREPAGSPVAASASRGRGRGLGGPGLTLELDGEVGLAGERPAAMNFGAAVVGTCGEIGDGGGYSGDHDPIPAAGKKRRARRCFLASRRGRRRHGTPAMDGGRARARRHAWEKEGE
jgi:hypothetical protein